MAWKLSGKYRMRKMFLTFAIAGPLFTGIQPLAQVSQPRYRLVDLGTFGGPASHFPNGYDGMLNNHGTAVGWSETAEDPNCFFFPFFCFHAFQARDDTLTDLGVLPGGSFSLASWMSGNSLITGFSDNGQFDPVYGIIEIHPSSGEMARLSISEYCQRAELEAWQAP